VPQIVKLVIENAAIGVDDLVRNIDVGGTGVVANLIQP